MVGQPGVGGLRQASGEHDPAVLRRLHHRTQQRMPGGGEPETVRLDRPGGLVEPVAAVLEGVGGQVHVPAGQQAGPGDGQPVDEGGREHFDQRLRAALIAPQGLQHHAVGVEVLEGVAQRHAVTPDCPSPLDRHAPLAAQALVTRIC